MREPRPAAIYALAHPETGEIRYIGFTTNPLQRWRAHCSPYRAQKTRLRNWLVALRREDLHPEMLLIGCTECEEYAERVEIALIAAARRLGWRLLNLTDGGVGGRGYKATKKEIERRRRVTKASWTPERRAQFSANNPNLRPEVIARKKAVWTDEKRKKHGEAVKARLTPEHVKKMTAASAAAWTPERRAKIGAALKGRVFSEETLRLMSEVQKGKPCSELAKRRSSETHKGVPKSPEQRAKMSASRLAYFARKRAEAGQ